MYDTYCMIPHLFHSASVAENKSRAAYLQVREHLLNYKMLVNGKYTSVKGGEEKELQGGKMTRVYISAVVLLRICIFGFRRVLQ
jgi:hypothetical protein